MCSIVTSWVLFVHDWDHPVTEYLSREECGEPYLLELHNVRMQEVAMIHDLPCNVLHVTQQARSAKEEAQVLTET